ncbi:MBL fold metallo-hydrolase [Cereibacter sphaeroides]|uniref:MBL fold metallo-hydrolase n=2 Tax=Cereibacter sphaeroides TaxID=1063 RepID=UPI001F236D79|nr:MBL fold metallo-hydrolase [Cereibacter sphaeroides]MCE6949681.1 MBL fold metallo-hydrolase [Cereibacter sphaeroides]
MSLTLTVHRGAREIGGSCIEIAHPGGERLVLDAGRPLDAPEGATGLLPPTLDRSRPATVLFSHAHQDHWGLIDEVPEGWELRAGRNAAKLIELTGEVRQRPLRRQITAWDSRSGAFRIGPFRVTPILTDHSAFDAYMLLIEADGRRILYSGDFRLHGRKSILVERMMSRPPRDIDILILEGTNLGTDKPCQTERALEDDFVSLFRRVLGRVFVTWSGQNIYRTVTLYRAAKRTGRRSVLDLYTADVMSGSETAPACLGSAQASTTLPLRSPRGCGRSMASARGTLGLAAWPPREPPLATCETTMW